VNEKQPLKTTTTTRTTATVSPVKAKAAIS